MGVTTRLNRGPRKKEEGPLGDRPYGLLRLLLLPPLLPRAPGQCAAGDRANSSALPAPTAIVPPGLPPYRCSPSSCSAASSDAPSDRPRFLPLRPPRWFFRRFPPVGGLPGLGIGIEGLVAAVSRRARARPPFLTAGSPRRGLGGDGPAAGIGGKGSYRPGNGCMRS